MLQLSSLRIASPDTVNEKGSVVTCEYLMPQKPLAGRTQMA